MDFYRDLEVHTGALQKQVNMITDYHRLLQSQARQVERDLQNAQSSPDQKKTARERRESVLGKMTPSEFRAYLLAKPICLPVPVARENGNPSLGIPVSQ